MHDADDRIIGTDWVPGNMLTPTDGTNVMLLTQGSLYPYFKSTKVCKCPADVKPNAYCHAVTVRSYSINTYLNGSDTADQLENATNVYTLVKKLDQIISPPPTKRLVFVDESQITLDDCDFWVIPSMVGTPYGEVDHWENFPTARHRNSAAFSFADGHVEPIQWKGQLLKTLEAQGIAGNYTEDLDGPDLEDLRQVQDQMALPASQN